MMAMGWSDWILYGLLFILSTAWMNLAGLLAELSTPWLVVILFYMTMFAFNVMAFHMMGYMIYRRGDVFGTLPVESMDTAGPLALFEELLENGQDEAARIELKRVIAESPDDLQLYRRMHNLALIDQAVKDLGANAGMLIPRLIDLGRVSEAVEILKDCSRLQCAPKGLSAESTLALARQLGLTGYAKQSFQLLSGFHKRYPRSALIFDAYLFAASLLSEQLDRDDLAVPLLEYLQTHYPQHERIGEVVQLREVITSLAGA